MLWMHRAVVTTTFITATCIVDDSFYIWSPHGLHISLSKPS
jgi:hypothetical protein